MIRRAGLDDARAVAAAHVGTWEEAYRGLVPDELLERLDLEEREGFWRQILTGETQTWVGEVDGAVAGFVSVGATREADRPGWGELYAIYVRAAHWGSGLGGELLETGELALRELGYSHAMLWVLRDNPRARRFYEKHGWRFDGSVKDFFPGVAEVRYERQL